MPDKRVCITFEDRTLHHGIRHKYQCCQLLRIDDEGLISHIDHRTIPEEEKALAEFFRRVGVERQGQEFS